VLPLRWINAGAGKFVQITIMGRSIANESTLVAPSEQRPDTVGAMRALAGRLALATVPAAWPAGVSQLAQAVDACQRSEPSQVSAGWPVRGNYLTT
jgi:hypothetical protein